MKLSNTFLLQAVWAVAITSLMLLSAAIAHADVIRADVIEDSDIPTFRGEIQITYDPSDIFTPTDVFFQVAGDHNFGLLAIDSTPTGWSDPQALLWDLTVDGVGGHGIANGLPLTIDPDSFVTDGVRLVNDGVNSYVLWDNANGAIGTSDVRWDNIQVIVPEASAFVLFLLGLLCVAGVRR